MKPTGLPIVIEIRIQHESFAEKFKESTIKVEPIKKQKDIRAIKKLLANKPRDLALFTIGINTNLRASDLLRLKIGQVKDLNAGDTIEIKEQKTVKGRRITLNKICIKAIQNLLASKQYQNNDYLFQSQRRDVLTVPFNSKSRILQLSFIAQFSEKYHSKSY